MIEELIKILDKGVDFNTVYSLYLIEDGIEYQIKDKKLWEGLKLNLINQGYLNGAGIITKKGKEVLQHLGEKKPVGVNKYQQLHTKLRTRLHVLSGKYQKTVQGKYAFLCNSIDLESRLSKVEKRYKLGDFNKIEELLIRHIDKAWSMKFEMIKTIEYYIEKSGNSQLATDYLNYQEGEQKEEKIQANIVDI